MLAPSPRALQRSTPSQIRQSNDEHKKCLLFHLKGTPHYRVTNPLNSLDRRRKNLSERQKERERRWFTCRARVDEIIEVILIFITNNFQLPFRIGSHRSLVLSGARAPIEGEQRRTHAQIFRPEKAIKLFVMWIIWVNDIRQTSAVVKYFASSLLHSHSVDL